MSYTLTVRRNAAGFDVDFTHAPDADEIFRLFRVYRLPTPFTPIADPAHVVASVAANPQNHGAIVVYEPAELDAVNARDVRR